MENITAKEWLKRARNARMRLKALEESKRRAYDRATSATRPLRRDFGSLSGNSSSDNKSDTYADLSVEVDRQRDEIDKMCAEVMRVIGQVDDNILATLLIEYYINGRSWDGVADVMNYSLRNVTRLHKRALAQVQRVLELHTDLC